MQAVATNNPLEPFRQTDRLSDSERAMLMGGACAKVYGWSPTKG
jgi:L-fuconolactonase